MRALVLSALLLTTTAYAASFDCKQAKSPREKAICADKDLSAADSKLAASYAALRTKLSPAAYASVQADQRDWLRYLDHACPPHSKGDREDITGCLTEEYSTRQDDLKLNHLAGLTIYTRASYVLTPATAADMKDAPEQDPGFGVARFHWPQIDRPTPAQAQYNAGVTAFVLHSTATKEVPHPTSMSQTADAGEEQDFTFVLRGANAHFLIADFTNFVSPYGAAHPSTEMLVHTWSFDLRHELTAADIFAANSGWTAKLQPAAIAELENDPDRKGNLWTDPKELTRGIREGLTRPQQWDPAHDGLNIRYGQYQVAAYVYGMPIIKLSWVQLKPYLNPAFHPETLPTLTECDDN